MLVDGKGRGGQTTQIGVGGYAKLPSSSKGGPGGFCFSLLGLFP